MKRIFKIAAIACLLTVGVVGLRGILKTISSIADTRCYQSFV